jgi:hypothetical protein
MEGIEKLHTDKYKEITNNWNYDASCTVTSLPVWDLENFKGLIFVLQSVQERCGDVYIGITPDTYGGLWSLLESFINTSI